MSETLKITLTALAGIIVFVLGQILVKLFIEPIQEQWKLRGKIIHTLSFYAMLDKDKAPKDLVEEWDVNLRSLASQLQATTAIPAYRLLGILRLVIKRENALIISIYLVQMTYVPAKVADDFSSIIMKKLNSIGLVTASKFEHRRTNKKLLLRWKPWQIPTPISQAAIDRSGLLPTT